MAELALGTLFNLPVRQAFVGETPARGLSSISAFSYTERKRPTGFSPLSLHATHAPNLARCSRYARRSAPAAMQDARADYGGVGCQRVTVRPVRAGDAPLGGCSGARALGIQKRSAQPRRAGASIILGFDLRAHMSFGSSPLSRERRRRQQETRRPLVTSLPV